jgi:hypothetical protein
MGGIFTKAKKPAQPQWKIFLAQLDKQKNKLHQQEIKTKTRAAAESVPAAKQRLEREAQELMLEQRKLAGQQVARLKREIAEADNWIEIEEGRLEPNGEFTLWQDMRKEISDLRADRKDLKSELKKRNALQ